VASRVYLDVLAHLRARVSGAAPIIASSLCARKARLERLIEALLEGAAPGAGCPLALRPRAGLAAPP